MHAVAADLAESPATVSSTTPPHNRVETEPPHASYLFLLDSQLPTETLIDALDAAEAWGVPLPKALSTLGIMSEHEYATSVARALGLDVADSIEVDRFPPASEDGRPSVRLVKAAPSAPLSYAVAADAGTLDDVDHIRRSQLIAGARTIIVPPRALAAAVERAQRTTALRTATMSLARTRPEFSARRPVASWQALTGAIVSGLFVGGFVVAPGYTTSFLMAVLAIPFIAVVLVRLIALAAVVSPQRSPTPTPIDDADLPTYSILVPLLNEPEILGELIASLSRLEYPQAKLDVVLVLEEIDLVTKAALLDIHLPGNMRVMVVPDAIPRTKPKALNYAMQFSHGDFVVVFDAEDRPDPDQLRKAIAAFRSGPINLACVQARLNIYNAGQSWFTRQFTVEYSALFDAILPALDWLRLPVPLGGTSNHFPRALLESVGGWDPFNVTEDADLGIRLARLGYVTQVLDSTTWEEAPVSWSQWLPQRTRWLKGWYQTYLVHSRRPRRLLADLGIWQTIGFHVVLGGIILSTLIHPFAYLLLAWRLLATEAFALPALFAGNWVWLLAMTSMLVSYLSAILVGILACRRRGHNLLLAALQLPLCWLLISFAAYRAFWQFWRNPFLWEKTAHGRADSRKPRDTRIAAP